MSRCVVLGYLDVIDDSVNDFRLCQLDIDIVLILDVDTKVIFYVALVLNV